jgi:hypothetical protein
MAPPTPKYGDSCLAGRNFYDWVEMFQKWKNKRHRQGMSRIVSTEEKFEQFEEFIRVDE